MAELPHNGSMPKQLIPLFPLQVVVFPRTRLPLHIFEERYKKMVSEAIRDNSEFGIVLAKEEGIVNAGCTVAVEKLLQMYPDGRMDILTRGRQRFEIESLDEEMEFLRANVNFFDDEDLETAAPELRAEALAQFRVLRDLESTEGARRSGFGRSAAQLSACAEPAGPGFFERLVAPAVGAGALEGTEPLPGELYSAPEDHPAGEEPGAEQRLWRETLGDLGTVRQGKSSKGDSPVPHHRRR